MMSTTNLFAELLVVGLGAFAWAALLALTMLGIDPLLLTRLAQSSAAAVPALAAIYLLGIITDRMADRAFHLAHMADKHTEDYPGGEAQFHKDRALVLIKSEQCAQLYEYSRSRQRICRGWAFNGAALLLALNLFLLARRNELPQYNWLKIDLIVSALLVALVFACWSTWKAMVDTEFKRIKEQADILRSMADA